jgi:hypothetical protein
MMYYYNENENLKFLTDGIINVLQYLLLTINKITLH